MSVLYKVQRLNVGMKQVKVAVLGAGYHVLLETIADTKEKP